MTVYFIGAVIVLLVILTFTTGNIRWYTLWLTFLSGAIGLLFYYLMLSQTANIPPEILEGEPPVWVIYFWPIIISLVLFGMGWSMRPK